MLRCASAPVTVEACSSMRPFALRQRRLILRLASAAGSTLPAYIFKAIPKSSSDPFGFALPPPIRFFSLAGARSTCETRCQIRSQNSLPDVQISAPLRDLSIPRARSAQLGLKQRSLPLRVARSSLAPRCAEIISHRRNNGSMLGTRYFPPGSLLFEPLGTTPIMHPDYLWVKQKGVR
jgi:hypothetical protein